MKSIGIKKKPISYYHEYRIAKFRDTICVKDGNFHVDLPWNDKLLKDVPSNFSLGKVIASRVSHNDTKACIDDLYFAVFQEQLKLGIIEEISAFFPEHHAWIPHRPIDRNDSIVHSTNIRPVFNCSLKVGGKPSLSEAAFREIDLTSDILGLIQ